MAHKPVSIPASRDRQIREACAEDDGFVSVGGLASEFGMLEKTPPACNAQTIKSGLDALAKLVQLSRLNMGLSLEQFAKKFSLDLNELRDLESASAVPEPRVLHQISLALSVSYKKLLLLAGHRKERSEALEQESLKFAARSGPMDKLSKQESQALQDFIRVLHD